MIPKTLARRDTAGHKEIRGMLSIARRRALIYVAVMAGLALFVPSAGAASQAPAVLETMPGMLFPVSVQKPASHYELYLTDEVYRSVQRSNLGDICVFNAAGESLPYALSRPRALEALTRVVPAKSLVWFPMPVELPGGSADTGAPLGVVIGPDGSLRAAPGARSAQEARRGDIIPLAPLWAGVDRSKALATTLTLTLDIADEAYQGTFRLEESDDLRTSRTVGRGSLLRVSNEGESLRVNRMDIDGLRGEYLLLFWDRTPPALTSVSVELTVEEAQDVPPPAFPPDSSSAGASGDPSARRWLLDVPGEARPSGGVVYHLNTHAPVDFAQLTLPRPNSMVTGELRTAFRPGDSYRAATGTEEFFRFATHEGNEGERRNPPVALDLNRDAQWLLLAEASALGTELPLLSVSWEPDILTFTASGDGPYTLATGCPGSRVRPLASLYPDGMIHTAESALLGQGEVLAASPEEPASWDVRRLILWGVLLFGLAFLGFMAYRLARGDKKQD